MSNSPAIRLTNVGKMYTIYSSRLDNVLDALGLVHLMPWRRLETREFWALRDINLELEAGSRLGIIGRNGVGKSTLLKLITGNLPPTEGKLEVHGQVQALLEAGAGFHPEFTGYENIRAALTYQGLSSKDIEVAIEDIADFTELGRVLEQPFKTYSLGMQARLVFATATVLKPEILIIDEILGAGDAYFANKSAERMKYLVEESGASVLLVSHAMDQIVRYCDECIWIEHGRVVKRGPSIEVVDTYEGFIRALEDRRLQAKNRKRHSHQYDPEQWDGYGDMLAPIFELQGAAGASCDISEITMLKNGQVEEMLKVGDVQDAHWSHMAAVSLDGSQWSEPKRVSEGVFCRSLAIRPGGLGTAMGTAVFYAYALFEDAHYTLHVRYRSHHADRLALRIFHNGLQIGQPCKLQTDAADWVEQHVPVMVGPVAEPEAAEPDPVLEEVQPEPQDEPSSSETRPLIRWPSEGSLSIEQVLLLGEHGQEQAVFSVGAPFVMRLAILAHRSGHFDLVLGATLYRLDGIFITNCVSPPMPVEFEAGETKVFRLDLSPLNLGDGHFVFSASIFEQIVSEHSRYDLISRAYEFQVVGNDPLVAHAVFQHPGHWTLV